MIGWIRKLMGGSDDGNGNGNGNGGAGAAKAPRRSAGAAQASREPFVVNLYDDRVVVHRPDGQREEVEWTRLDRVIVRVQNRDPWDGLWLILPGIVAKGDKPYGCVVPATAVNYEALLAHLRAMPGFDQHKFDNALRDARSGKSRSDAIVWKHGAVPAAGSDSHDHDDDQPASGERA